MRSVGALDRAQPNRRRQLSGSPSRSWSLCRRARSLNESQRREVKDDLCLVDFKIGRPTYTLAEQRAVCLDAMKEPGSESASIVAQIDTAERGPRYARSERCAGRA